MRSTLYILFPFLGVLVTSGLLIYFLIWKRTDNTIKVEEKVKSQPLGFISPKKAIHTTPAQTFDSVRYGDVPVVEGFGVNDAPKFPVWNGPSMKIAFSIQDDHYKQYAGANLYPTQDMLDILNSIPITDAVIPDYGSYLSNFDADISSIPWDAENAQYLEKDVVWGYVSSAASRSIFTKSYIQKALSDPNNVVEEGDAILYHSLFLGVNAYDPNTTMMLQAAEATAAAVGQTVMTTVATNIYNSIMTQAQDEMSMSINKSGKGVLTNAQMKLFQKTAGRSQLGDLRNDARQQKLLAGELLTSAELLEDEIYNKKYVGTFERFSGSIGKHVELAQAKLASIQQNIASKLGKPVQAVGRQLAKFGPISAAMSGFNNATKYIKDLKALLGKKMTAKLATAVTKIGVFKAITAFLASMSATISAVMLIPGAQGAINLAIVIYAITAAWSVMDGICTVAFLTLQVLLPTLFDKAFENGGVCPPGGKPLATLINDDFLYFIVTTFLPPFMVLDVFEPYVCYLPNGSMTLKSPYKLVPFIADTTLSVNKHAYARGTEPRGDYTGHKNTGDSLPPGWKVTAGIARAQCDPGTWTSSDVDMLCNISTYVPRTYAKESRVPRTYAKGSRVPETKAKDSKITTYTRSANIYPVDYKPCNSQWPGEDLDTKTGIGTQTLDCWGSSSDTVYMSCGCRRWSC
jgi:hypothetical protein